MLLVVVLSLVLLAACTPTSQQPAQFPPPEGYSSWEEYNQAMQQTTKPPTTTIGSTVTVITKEPTSTEPTVNNQPSGTGYDALSTITYSESVDNRTTPTFSDFDDGIPETILWDSSYITALLTQLSDGTFLPSFKVTIPDVPCTQYELNYKMNSEAEWDSTSFFYVSGGTTIEISPVVGNTEYNFRVRGRTRLGTSGEWSNIVNKTSLGDETPPATPTGLTATSTIGSIILEWTSNNELDKRHYEVHKNTTGTTPSSKATPYAITTSNYFSCVNLNYDTTYYFWVRAVDLSGNKSDYSSSVNEQPRKSMAADLLDVMQPYHY